MRRLVLIALMSAASALAFAAEPVATATAGASAKTKAPMEMLPDLTEELVKVDNVVGTGPMAMPGNTVVVNYTGWLYKPMAVRQRGRIFDSSLAEGHSPLDFVLGKGQVIKGWDQGVMGMKVGGKRTLLIPSALAYGKAGSQDVIPPNSALVFEVELLEVK
jgi:FKBP-type peptidyl-prolyl cis-trans isomerase FkpA